MLGLLHKTVRNATCRPAYALAGAARLLSSAEESFITIDRSGLYQTKEHSHDAGSNKEPETQLARHLKSIIRVSNLFFKHFLIHSIRCINPILHHLMH